MQEIKGLFFRDFENSYFPEILKEMYRDKIYDRFLLGKKDLVILDIGGNQGLTTFFFYPFAKRIYCIEPSEQHTDVIRYMLKHNQMDDRVSVIQKAINTKDEEVSFYHNDNVTMFSMKPEVNSKPDDKETVQGIRLDTLFEENNIDHVDFMKLDIEGSEVEVIGGEGFKNVADKIDALVVEYHQWSGRNPSQLTTTLMDLGFDVFPIPADAILYGAVRKAKNEVQE